MPQLPFRVRRANSKKLIIFILRTLSQVAESQIPKR